MKKVQESDSQNRKSDPNEPRKRGKCSRLVSDWHEQNKALVVPMF